MHRHSKEEPPRAPLDNPPLYPGDTPRIRLRPIPRRPPPRPGVWIGGYRVHVLDVVAAIFGLAVLVAIRTHSLILVALMVGIAVIIAGVWK